MKASVKSKLERLRSDFAQIRGQPFVHFSCPVLFKDERTPLCQAHIINYAFANSSRAWTVQRNDVDSFYGTNFEADFLAIQYHVESRSPAEVLTDKKLSRILSPRILVDGVPVDYFIANEALPEHFTGVEFHSDGQSVQLGLKIPPENVATLVDHKWEIEIGKDVRMPALVSLIKAAHLTLFHMLGYRYALSAGGHFVGRRILGEFFRQNHGTSKSEVGENALAFFREFAHMVRPVQASDFDLQGTVTDGMLFICRASGGFPWALIVFIRTSRLLHAVMIPVFDQPDAVATFFDFLRDENDSIDVSWCRFEQDRWEINRQVRKLVWPKSGVLYP